MASRSIPTSLPLRACRLLGTLCAFLLVAVLAGCGAGSPTGAGATTSVSGVDSAGVSSAQTTVASDAAASSVAAADAGSLTLDAGKPTPPPASPSPIAAATPLPPVSAAGLALGGLSAAQQQLFTDGRARFAAPERAPRLGPIFNGNACAQCHASPVIGGAGPQRITRFGRLAGGVFDPLESLGGSLLQTGAIATATRETVPASANVTARRRTFGVYGFGLIEAIPDSDITAYAALQARNAPGQAGQVNFVTSPTDATIRVGRFGWKCQQATLLDFAGDALANEMGVSNRLFALENRTNALPVPVPTAEVEDRPDTRGLASIDYMAAFMRFVAPYPSRVSTHAADDLATDATVSRGIAAFNKAACTVCHRPSWVAGGNVPELRGRRIWAFSDFLLHDVGTGDAIVQGSAPGNKLRTAPLMGVATQFGFLHDGSSPTVEDAILRHGNEARPSRDRYTALTAQERADLLTFVRGL